MLTLDIDNHPYFLGLRPEAKALEKQICDALPALYTRHCSSYTLKGFSINMSIEKTPEPDHPTLATYLYIVTAVAELAPPPSISDDFDGTLRDMFIEDYSYVDLLEAMEALLETVEEMLEEKEEEPYIVKTGPEPTSEYTFW